MTWYLLTLGDCDTFIIDNSTGTITIYGMTHKNNGWAIRILDYAGVTKDEYVITENELTEISLSAKSLTATFTWSSDSDPCVNILVPLYMWNGMDYVFIADYMTDASGIVSIIELMSIGTYKFAETIFSITADDTLVVVPCIVESLLGKEKRIIYLDFIKGRGIQIFFFMLMR